MAGADIHGGGLWEPHRGSTPQPPAISPRLNLADILAMQPHSHHGYAPWVQKHSGSSAECGRESVCTVCDNARTSKFLAKPSNS